MDVCEAVQAIAAGRILLAVEATRQSRAVIAAAIKRALQSHAEVLVLSVRERDYTRGIAWDVRPAGEIAEVVSHAIYELQRVGVPARGLIRTARSGRVADEILYTASRHHADEIVIGKSERSWIGRVLYGSVSPRVLRLAEVPVTAVPTREPAGASAQP
ncbi:MAG TPA: universal stress protein, partial [Candidatus Sulfotelmatobacter sp.]|nr:universal stress protein [Candidatus Sulfotelmatobacter sp.]